MSTQSRFLRIGLLLAAVLAATMPARAQSGWGTVRLDNWGFFQRNTNGTDQWQYRPRIFVPYRTESGWSLIQRADVPLLYTNNSGPGNPDGGYTGGVGAIMFESIVDTPEVAKNLTLRGSVRFVLQAPKGQPFGATQYQIAPGLGLTYQMPDALNGVTLSPYVRYFFGFDADPPGSTLTHSLNLFPTVTFGLSGPWSLAFWPENPITYNHNDGSWFVPLDFMFVNRLAKNMEFGIGGAVKLGNPSKPSYDYIVDGRLTLFF
jgi:hypothetical protein